jgi:hypothetical protein
MARWNSLERLKLKSTAKESRLCRKEGAQAEMVSNQLVLEFVNTALYGSSAVIVAPDFQGRVAAFGDKDPKHVAGQINELTTNSRLVSSDQFAYHQKAPPGFPIAKFEMEITNRVNCINGSVATLGGVIWIGWFDLPDRTARENKTFRDRQLKISPVSNPPPRRTKKFDRARARKTFYNKQPPSDLQRKYSIYTTYSIDEMHLSHNVNSTPRKEIIIPKYKN